MASYAGIMFPSTKALLKHKEPGVIETPPNNRTEEENRKLTQHRSSHHHQMPDTQTQTHFSLNFPLTPDTSKNTSAPHLIRASRTTKDAICSCGHHVYAQFGEIWIIGAEVHIIQS